MPTRADNASLRATLAALAAIAALLAFVIWQGASAALRGATDEAMGQAGRAATLAIARSLDRNSSDPARDLAEAVAAAGAPVAAALYDARGTRAAVASSPGLESLAARLPDSAPRERDGEALPAAVPGAATDDMVVFALGLGDGRTLVVGRAGRAASTLGGTLAAYEALTLVVVLTAIGFGLRRLGRATQARFEGRRGQSGATADGPQRETEFVVETFQSVIGELQVKGKRLELESLRERERAERSERFSERVIAQMPTGLVVVGRTGRVTAANASARDLFADLPRERTDAVEYARAFRDARELVGMLEECLRDGATFARREIEMRAGTGGARSKYLGVSVSPIGPEGPPEAALCLMTDLTEVVGLRDRVRIQETMASLGEMAAGLTHELKNSLATIQGFAQLLADVSPEAASEPADALVDEVASLSRMVTDFLNFARPQEVARAPVRLAEVAECAVERLRPAVAEVGFSVHVAPEAESACVLGDETLLGRALQNVLQNALDALEASPAPRTLVMRVAVVADDVVVEITDNGPGIAADDLPKIFIPFFTTRSRGHGIGLALTQKIVLAHGGRIGAESSPAGTTVRFVLPTSPVREAS